jgi:ABC-type amino acid transport system permease subunit
VLFIGLVVSGLYYLAASIVFPGEFGDRADFDAHYMAHHRQVLGAVLASNLIGQGWVQVELFRTIPLDVWITIAAYYALLVIGIVTSNKRLSIGVLAALILLYLYSAVEALIVRPAF